MRRLTENGSDRQGLADLLTVENAKARSDGCERDVEIFNRARGLACGVALDPKLAVLVPTVSHVIRATAVATILLALTAANGYAADPDDLARMSAGDTNLAFADLSGADLSGWIEFNVDLRNANLSGVDLSGAILIQARLSDADLSESDLRGADLSMADLSSANLFRARLNGANLIEADLSGANLSGASLFLTNLTAVNMSEASLVGADLTGASLYEADLSLTDMRYLAVPDVPGTEGIPGARMTLIPTIMVGANLYMANLEYATLIGVIFDGTNLSYANFCGADLHSDLDLDGAYLHGATCAPE